MNTNHIQSAAKSVQSARRSYWAAVASDAPAWRIEAQAQALAIASGGLVREVGGSAEKARAAEVEYLNAMAR